MWPHHGTTGQALTHDKLTEETSDLHPKYPAIALTTPGSTERERERERENDRERERETHT